MFFFGKKEEPISGQLEIDLILSARKAVCKTVLKLLEVKLEEKPNIKQRPTVQWQGKMKLSKPSGYTYAAGVVIPRAHAIDNGMIVFFISENIAELFAGSLGIRPGAEGQGLVQSCEKFFEQAVGYFRESLVKLGYEELKIPEPESFLEREALLDYFRSTKYVITFYQKGERFLQIEMGIGPLQKIH